VPVSVMPENDARAPHLKENLWGYGKRLRFVDGAMQRELPGRRRCELRVLDVGCGNGSQLAVPLANSGYQVVAVDRHLPSIQRGRGLAPAVEFHHGVVEDLPISKFDCVIVSEVLEHLDAPEELLTKVLPHLSESGLLVVTVPNGYGEFELDRRLYQALQVDKFVVRLRSVFKGDNREKSCAGSDEESPHLQQFSLTRLHQMFDRSHLVLLETRGTSFVSGPLIAHLLGKTQCFVDFNAAIADHLPLLLVAGWMFCLKRAP
jgi:2-polyprenyl-3-methyl-5-hydroxy-6-metoxy-1,4-benzoquinol methylase